MNGMPDMIDDDFRRYTIYSRTNEDYQSGLNHNIKVACWTESRKAAEFAAAKHIVVDRTSGIRIFPRGLTAKLTLG